MIELDGWALIQAERARQITEEGYSDAHDDALYEYALCDAGDCYREAKDRYAPLKRTWPFEAGSWKPRDRKSNLVRAGALYLAHAARLERAGEAERAQSMIAEARDVGAEIDELEAA